MERGAARRRVRGRDRGVPRRRKGPAPYVPTPTPGAAAPPERCVEVLPSAESIAERKLRQRQLTEDGNVEISGRDLC